MTPTPRPNSAKIEKKMRIMADLKHPELSEPEINHRTYALIEKGCR